MHLQIPFSEIPESGLECELSDASWFPVNLLEQAGPVMVQVRLTRQGDTRVELSGTLQVQVVLECDRCLERFVYPVDASLQILLEVAGSGEDWHLRGLETGEGELETVTLQQPLVDLAELLRQQLLLSLPEKNVCREDCSGLCPDCGADRNAGECDCCPAAENSPFAVLGKLRDK